MIDCPDTNKFPPDFPPKFPPDFTRAILFDLDGTLVDTAPDLLAALNHALKDTRRRPIDLSQVRTMIGQGALALVHRALELSDSPPADKDDIPTITARLLRYYRENLARYSKAYDGTYDVLAYLKASGIVLGVATNKPEDMAVKILDLLGLKKYFSVILGYRGDFLRKPDPAFLGRAARLVGVSCDHCVMVGDSIYDRIAARLIGMDSISVGYGYGPLGDHPPDIDDIRQIPQCPHIMTLGRDAGS